MRFLNSAEDSELDYWIENCTSTSAKVWVKVPTVTGSGNTTIYIYYGNNEANSNSNGTNTMKWFEDFSSNASYIWYMDGSYRAWFHFYNFTEHLNNSEYIFSYDLMYSEPVIAYKYGQVYYTGFADSDVYYYYANYSNAVCRQTRVHCDTDEPPTADNYPLEYLFEWGIGPSHNVYRYVNTTYRIDYIYNGSHAWTKIYFVDNNTLIDSISNVSEDSAYTNHFFVKVDYFYNFTANKFEWDSTSERWFVDANRSGGNTTGDFEFYLDNIMARKYASVIPTHIFGSEESSTTKGGTIPENTGSPFYTTSDNPVNKNDLACLCQQHNSTDI